MLLRKVNYTKKYIRLLKILFAVLFYLIYTFCFDVDVYVKVKLNFVGHLKSRNIVYLIKR